MKKPIKKEKQMIKLRYGGKFNERDLIKHIRGSKRDYIIQGQQNVSFSKHTKPNSLDYWLRQFGLNQNTTQAVNSVINDLVATGLFR
ncbi:MAG: hypothetical protein Q7J06_00445, partial [Bacteroidales bacterium]|nr:hypothetical protein [Bacteroidales bacterium]